MLFSFEVRVNRINTDSDLFCVEAFLSLVSFRASVFFFSALNHQLLNMYKLGVFGFTFYEQLLNHSVVV